VIERGPVPLDRARRIASDIAGALAAAHEAGVIHRDLKPENVLIKPDGTVKVVDFGIAQVEGSEVSRLTRTGFALGTPAYMAPEQLLGASVDRRADIYAWGIVLSEMLNGRHPLAGGPITQAAAPAGAASSEMGVVISRCLERDPASRYASARDLLQALGSQPGADASGPAPERSPARWWWEFHQGMAALVYWLMVVPSWYARGHIGGAWGRAFFIVTLAAVIVAANLRLHLWFTSRFYDRELTWVHGRSGRWIRAADWTFAASLLVGGLLVGEVSPLSLVLPSVAVGAVVAFLLIEPVTARAAFSVRAS
jgi:hypothetical protein